jgi:hypothetical protein
MIEGLHIEYPGNTAFRYTSHSIEGRQALTVTPSSRSPASTPSRSSQLAPQPAAEWNLLLPPRLGTAPPTPHCWRPARFVHIVDIGPVAVTHSCSLAVVPALSLKLVARRHVDYGRTRSMICTPA